MQYLSFFLFLIVHMYLFLSQFCFHLFSQLVIALRYLIGHLINMNFLEIPIINSVVLSSVLLLKTVLFNFFAYKGFNEKCRHLFFLHFSFNYHFYYIQEYQCYISNDDISSDIVLENISWLFKADRYNADNINWLRYIDKDKYKSRFSCKHTWGFLRDPVTIVNNEQLKLNFVLLHNVAFLN